MNDDDSNSITLGTGTSTYSSEYDYITISDTMSMANVTYTGASLGTITIPNGGYSTTSATTSYVTSNGTWGAGMGSILTTNINNPGITVKGDAEFEGDIKVEGKSLKDWMTVMEKRLAILVPDPKKLKKYEALQKAYNHYKMLEALCEADDDEEK